MRHSAGSRIGTGSATLTCGATWAPLEVDVTLIQPESFAVPPLSVASSCTLPVVDGPPEV